MHPTITRFGRNVLAAIAVGAIGSLLTVPVQADGPLVRLHYSGTDTFSFSDCGYVINADVTFSGLFMLKRGHHGDPTPYYFDNYLVNIVYSSPETGRWFTVDRNGLYRDLRITNVEGTIYRFDAIEVGMPIVVRDMDGKVVLRDRGLLHYQFSVDTKGDSDLSNDEFLTDFQLVADRGAHPFFYADFCAVASTLLL
jgi:hypothetical protein